MMNVQERAEKLNRIWRNMHSDYKSLRSGIRYVLVLREGGTTLVPMYALSDIEIERLAK